MERCKLVRITTDASVAGASGPLWRRVAWFVALWAAGVLAVAAVAWPLRWLLGT